MTAFLVALALANAAPAATTPQVAAELTRLSGHKVVIAPDGASYRIERVAAEGTPLVGRVHKRRAALFLHTGDQVLRLTGPLARARIAGPGYKVWVLGRIESGLLRAHRIGVLAPPLRSPTE